MKLTTILNKPNIGDTISSSLLGYKSRHTMIWSLCPKCGKVRWVINMKSERNRRCRDCHIKYHSPLLRLYRQVKTITIYDVPKEGDVIKGKDINKKYSLYQWMICPDCKNGRWVSRNNVALYPKCVGCGNKTKKIYTGENSSQWKGGKIISRYGYIYVRIYKDNLYYSMTNSIGYVAEHRLVMAQMLGRCLERWEIVHHKHTRFPAGSLENKQDNRYENLELLPSRHIHDTITVLEKQMKELRQEVVTLTTKVKLCEWRIRELETIKREWNRA